MEFTPKVSCRYGAPMGRVSSGALDLSRRLYLRRIPLNGGGYDRGGAYWGIGAPLWCVMDQNGATRYFRAANRHAAKVYVRETFGNEGAFFK